MKKVLAVVALGATVVSLTAVAAQDAPVEKPGVVDPTAITGGTYHADPNHSLVQWRVDHMGFNDYFGLFGDVEGTLQLDPAKPAQASVDITIPVSSVTVVNPDLRAHLLRAGKDGGKPDFFGPEPAPAHFVSTKVEVSPGGMTADVTGDLTLNGKTREVKLYTRFSGTGPSPMGKAETVGFEGHTTIRRSDFGLVYGIPLVSDDVELEFTAAFEKAPAK